MQDAAPSRAADYAKRVADALWKTLALLVPVFVLATSITFLLGVTSGLSPAHLQLGESATPAQVARIEHEWGLDRPLLVQYFDWFGALLSGDLGRSWYNGHRVSDLLASRAVVSLSVAGLALAIGVVFGFALGVLAARYPRSWLDRGITAFTTVISVMPAFVVGIALVTVFSVTLKWLPSAGYVPIAEGVDQWLKHLILPALALSLDTTSDIARQLRVGLISAYRENYVVGALLRGLSDRRVFFVHVLRNGVGPALTILGMKFPNLLGGAIVTEAVFGLAGYGKFANESALRGDVPAVQGVLVVSIVLVVSFNVLVNLLLNRITPRAQRGA